MTDPQPLPTDAEMYMNVAGQCAATATSGIAASILVDGGNGTLRQLLNDAADAIRAGWTTPQPTQEQAGAVPPPWMEPGAFFGGRPPRAMDIDSEDFYGITEAIHHALEMLGEHDDDNTDASPLDPKRSRRLCQALMAAWMLEYPREAAAHGIKGGQHGTNT